MTTNSGGLPFASRAGKFRVTGAAATPCGPVGFGVLLGVGLGVGVTDGVCEGVREGVFEGVWVGVAGGVLGSADGWPFGCPPGSMSAHPTSTAATTTAAARRCTPGLTTPLLTHGVLRRLARDTQLHGNPAGDR
ncbi:hypothetical protein GCM10009745_32680 [Kribbella yunnanensis]|uniref:Uncharacterized protein n=1 Tax=Kribbella yunnanensis TaxID=190194 RepID=A0ABP4TDR4_9ACTN